MATLEESQAVLRQLSPTREKVDRAVEAAIAVAQPSRVILFGSWARGQAEWDSDLDLAVLVPDDSACDLARIRKQLRRKLDEIPMTVDLILATESYAQQLSGSVNSIFHSIFEQGCLAYEREPNANCGSSAA
jgi:predicted nucleotidyltransferase